MKAISIVQMEKTNGGVSFDKEGCKEALINLGLGGIGLVAGAFLTGPLVAAILATAGSVYSTAAGSIGLFTECIYV